MDAQSVFDFCRGGPARPKHPERLFFALIPEAQSALRIAHFAEGFFGANALKGTPVRADRLHVSLHHLGDFKRLRSDTLYAARQAGDSIALDAFEMTLHSIASFAGKAGARPLVLLGEGDGLSRLHAMLGAALKKNGLRAGGLLAPHMTLLYTATQIPVQAIEPIRFAVKDFVLIHSALGLKKYNLIQRWPLERQRTMRTFP